MLACYHDKPATLVAGSVDLLSAICVLFIYVYYTPFKQLLQKNYIEKKNNNLEHTQRIHRSGTSHINSLIAPRRIRNYM